MFYNKFSVLMPVYFGDQPRLLDKAIISVFKNSIRPKYLYLIIDGPIRLSLDLIILKHKKNFGAKICIHKLKKNRGLSIALNIGLKKIKDDIVIRADADDINSSERFKNLLKKINEGYDVVGSNIIEYSENKLTTIRKVPTNQSDIIFWIKYRNPFNHMSVAYKKSKILKLGGYPHLHFFEDYALWAKVVKANLRVTNLNKILVKAFVDNNFYKRRGGFKYLLNIYNFQKFLLDQKIISINIFLVNCIIRSFFSMLSSPLRYFFYKKFLRNENS